MLYYTLIGVFTASLLGIIFLFIRALRRGHAREPEISQGDAEQSDAAHIYTPILFELEKRGITAKLSGCMQHSTVRKMFKKNTVRVYVRLRAYTKKRVAMLLEHVSDREHIPHNKGASSFFLKDISEHKKKINGQHNRHNESF